MATTADSAGSQPASPTQPPGDSLTLHSLLRTPDLQLRLLTAHPLDDPRLHQPLAWAHNSDLFDPTPWLSAGGLLLTDGAQFGQEEPPQGSGHSARARRYVAQLEDSGVLALGFGSGVVHATVPSALLAACRERDLPLLEVPRHTPFMAVIKAVADAQAGQQRARLEWSLAAQRAIARAALRPDGLTAVLRELQRRLGCWVMLFDAAGHRLPLSTTLQPAEEVLAEVEQAVRRVLYTGVSGGARIAGDGVDVTLQTLGRSRSLRGVLAVGTTTPLEQAGHDLVTSVIALASITLDQSRAIEDARRQLRAGLLELVLAGSLGVAGRSATQLVGPLPAAPVRVCLVRTPGPPDALIRELEQLAHRQRGEPFFAEQDDRLVVIARHDRLAPLVELFEVVGAIAGSSTPVAWKELRLGLDEARRAAGRATAARRYVPFEEVAGHGLIGVLHSNGGAEVAAELLRPLLQRPGPERDELLTTLRVWLDHNCAWDPAARALNIHRHTLRSRIDGLAAMIGRDLNRFPDRAELWAALECLDS